MFRAKVRGIYTTALTRLLLDNGFRIVQPSAPIKERFKLSNTYDGINQPDIEISDRFDRQGVNVIGDTVTAEKFILILFDTLDDVIVRRRLSIFSPIGIDYEENYQMNLAEIMGKTLREIESSIQQRKIRINVEFPSLSKRKLDEIRSRVVPTLSGHHYYKACGGKIAYMVEMAEKLLDRGCPYEEVERLFKETIWREYPYEGAKINIEHVKVNGRIYSLGEARIIKFDEQTKQIKLLRVFSTPGVYDGLGVRKEPGDYAITSMKIGEWSFRTSYFSKNGEYKGTYVNINTPIEVYPTKVRYIDLEVDICMWPNGRIRKIDDEKLDDIVRRGYISGKLRQIIHEKIEEVLNNLSLEAERENRYINQLINND